MKQRKPDRSNNTLPLPSPGSPEALDDKVLAYARSQAPAKTSLLRPRWVGGMAAASVVAVAVLITQPQLETTPPRSAPPATELSAPGGMAADAPNARQVAAPAARHKMLRSGDQLEFRDNDGASANPPMAEQSLSEEALLTNPATNPDRVREDLKQLQLEAAPAMSPLAANSAVDLDSLQHCAALLQRGEEDAARSAYRELREACRDCGLPETLEQAINSLIPDAQPMLK